jgi:3-dehydroquinate synthase
MPDIIATTSTGSYEISISNNSILHTGKVAKSHVKGNKAFLVTDENVAGLYLAKVQTSLEQSGFEVECYILTPGEESKNQTELFTLYEKFNKFSLTRADIIIALGGGVVGDLTGFAAATYLRGVPLLSVPTTLLAQVDSSVGGKTAIDMPYGKNLVGSFYPPCAVIVDPKVLSTLPRSILNDGMAEVIKYGCIRDISLFDRIESNMMDLEWVLERCIRIKTSVVSNDERDRGERMLLNFGHTVGHAIEKVTGYKTYSHGQAVSIGMVIASRLGEKLGVTKAGTADRIEKCLAKLSLPVKNECDIDQIIGAIKSDKKTFSDTVYFVLLKEIGEGVLYPIHQDVLSSALREVL